MTTPIGQLDEDGNVDGMPFGDWLSQAITDSEGASAYNNQRDRPYNGQPQTTFGERGRTLVEGLTMRDVMDCFIGGVLDCCGVDQPELYAIADQAVMADIYDVDLGHLDPGAWWQNMACRIEKMMGIYPNVGKLEFEHDQET